MIPRSSAAATSPRRSPGLRASSKSVRRAALPVAFTRVVYADDGADAGVFCLESAEPAHVDGDRACEPDRRGSRAANLASMFYARRSLPHFFGTNLANWLVSKAVDTLIVAGCTTSGCVRATVVDAMSFNFRTIVATDCVGDRALEPHRANLFDMEQKYADLLSNDQIGGKLRNSSH